MGKVPRDAREGRAPFDAACTGKRSGHARHATLMTATGRPASLKKRRFFTNPNFFRRLCENSYVLQKER